MDDPEFLDWPDFLDWSDAVAALCARGGRQVPDRSTLGFMYDDGLEPEAAAAPETRRRYCSRPQRSFAAGAGDLHAQRLHQPD